MAQPIPALEYASSLVADMGADEKRHSAECSHPLANHNLQDTSAWIVGGTDIVSETHTLCITYSQYNLSRRR